MKFCCHLRRLNKVSFLFFLGCFFSVSALAQRFSADCWHKGSVHLVNGKSVSGLIKYDLKNDIVRFEVDGKKDFTFTPNAVHSFQFIDFLDSTKRSFITYNVRDDDGFEMPMFFEYLLDGKLPLMCREEVMFRPAGAGGVGGSSRMIEYTFYIVGLGGELLELPYKRKKIIKYFRGKQNEMKTFLHENRINLRDKKDIIKVFQFYNSLFITHEAPNSSDK